MMSAHLSSLLSVLKQTELGALFLPFLKAAGWKGNPEDIAALVGERPLQNEEDLLFLSRSLGVPLSVQKGRGDKTRPSPALFCDKNGAWHLLSNEVEKRASSDSKVLKGGGYLYHPSSVGGEEKMLPRTPHVFSFFLALFPLSLPFVLSFFLFLAFFLPLLDYRDTADVPSPFVILYAGGSLVSMVLFMYGLCRLCRWGDSFAPRRRLRVMDHFFSLRDAVLLGADVFRQNFVTRSFCRSADRSQTLPFLIAGLSATISLFVWGGAFLLAPSVALFFGKLCLLSCLGAIGAFVIALPVFKRQRENEGDNLAFFNRLKDAPWLSFIPSFSSACRSRIVRCRRQRIAYAFFSFLPLFIYNALFLALFLAPAETAHASSVREAAAYGLSFFLWAALFLFCAYLPFAHAYLEEEKRFGHFMRLLRQKNRVPSPSAVHWKKGMRLSGVSLPISDARRSERLFDVTVPFGSFFRIDYAISGMMTEILSLSVMPPMGQLFIAGIPVSEERLSYLRYHVASLPSYVPAMPLSVTDFLGLFAPQASQDMKIHALKEAGCESVSLTDSFERMLPGVRATVFLAGIFLRQPSFLVLNKPEDVLPSEAMKALVRKLTPLKGRLTCIMRTQDPVLGSLATDRLVV